MAKRPDVVVLSRGERLRDSKRQSTSMALPLAVHHRLDLIADAARDAGATRAEIVAMLITEASMDCGDLERRVLQYRKLRVGDVVPEEFETDRETPQRDDDNVISIKPRGPGRPVRRTADN